MVVVEAEVLLVRSAIETIMMLLSVITGIQGPCLAMVMAIDLHNLHIFNLNIQLHILLLSTVMAMVIHQDHNNNNNVLRLCLQEVALLLTINGGTLTQVPLTMLPLMQQIYLMLLPFLDLTRC
jgi:hypothetical protein